MTRQKYLVLRPKLVLSSSSYSESKVTQWLWGTLGVLIFLTHISIMTLPPPGGQVARVTVKYTQNISNKTTTEEPLSTLCLEKVLTFILSVTLTNLNQFSNFLRCWKAYEFRWKPVRQHPPHIRHVATLTWEIKKKSNFQQIFSRKKWK